MKKLIKEILFPNDIWQLTPLIENILKRQLLKLPKREVSQVEQRYPTLPSGMRAFLDKFYARHYFQVQNSLFDYLTSQEFLEVINSGKLQILDIGSGPAVASLAITDFIFQLFHNISGYKRKPLEITYVLNDTSDICLGTGKEMLNNYFSNRSQ